MRSEEGESVELEIIHPEMTIFNMENSVGQRMGDDFRASWPYT